MKKLHLTQSTILFVFSIVAFFAIVTACKRTEDFPEEQIPEIPSFEGIDYRPDTDAVVLSEPTIDYIANGDDLLHKITFTASTPAKMIPKVGKPVIVAKPTEDFPDGLLAKAKSVSTSGDGSTVIDYEPISIEEAFSSLTIDTTGIDLAHYVKAITNANGAKVDYITSKAVSTGQLTLNIPELVISNDDETATITANMGMTLGMRIQIIIDDYKLLSFRFVLDPTITFDVLFEANNGMSFVKTKPILTVACAGIPVGPIVVTPIVELSIAGGIDGKFDVKAGVNYVNKTSYGITYIGTSEPKEFFSTHRNLSEDLGESPLNLISLGYAEGGISAGLETAAGLGVFGTVLYSTIGLQEKIRFGGNIRLDMEGFSSQYSWYQAMYNSMLTTDFTLMGSASLKTLGYNLVDPFNTSEARFRLDSLFIVPHYNKIKVTPNNTGADFKLEVTNNLLSSVTTGVKIYNYSDNIPPYLSSDFVDEVELGQHKTIPQNLEYNELTGTINGLLPGRTYVAVPYFEMDDMLFHVDEALEVFTTTADFQEQLRDLLMDIYNSAGGSSWGNKTNWGTDALPEDWAGVAKYPQSGDNSIYYTIKLPEGNALSGNLEVGNHLEGTNCYWGFWAENTDGLTSIKIDDKNFRNFIFPQEDYDPDYDESFFDNVTHLEIHSQSLDYGSQEWISHHPNTLVSGFDHIGPKIATYDFSNSNIDKLHLCVDTEDGNRVITSVKLDNCKDLESLKLHTYGNKATCPILSLNGSEINSMSIQKINVGSLSWLPEANGVNTIVLNECIGEAIIITNLAALSDFRCHGSFPSISITGCNELLEINFENVGSDTGGISVGSANVLNCSKLNRFDIGGLIPSELTIGNCPELINIYADTLSTCSITQCNKLKELNFDDIGLTEFSISECDAIETISVYANDLTELTLANFPRLANFNCMMNDIVSLSITNCPSIRYLSCNNNKLSGLMPNYLLNVINAGGYVSYDKMYEYYGTPLTWRYVDTYNHYGFYYAGEPESLTHGPLSE